MDVKRLESLVVNVPGEIKSNPAEQAEETIRIMSEVTEEIKKATAKCMVVTQIGGQPASIGGLSMTGKTSVENIGITYLSNGETKSRDYSLPEFYDL